MAQKVATKLLKAGLVSEIKAKSGMEAWRRDEETGSQFASPSFISAGIIASRVVLSPMGNGRAHLTACDAEMARRCKRDNALL